MLLSANIEISTIQIIDYLVYIKVQWTSELTDIVCPHAAHSAVNDQNTV